MYKLGIKVKEIKKRFFYFKKRSGNYGRGKNDAAIDFPNPQYCKFWNQIVYNNS